jgi:hypothetical protein
MFAKTTSSAFWPLTLLLALALGLTGCNGPKKAAPAAPKAEAPGANQTPKAEAPAPAEASPAATAEAAPEAPAQAPEAEEAAPAEASPAANAEAAPEAEPRQPPTVEPEALDPLTNAAELARRLEAIQVAAVKELELAHSMVDSISQRKGLLELRRKELAESGFAEVCPEGDDLAGLKRSLNSLARQFDYTMESLRIVESKVQRRELPDEIPAGKGMTVLDMDFVKPLLVSFTLQGDSDDRLPKWLDTLKKDARVMKVQRIKNLEQGGWLVNLEAYGLFNDEYPVLKSNPIDFKQVLKRSGIYLEMDELVRRDPVGRAHGAAIAYREYNDLINNLNAANILESELRWIEAKLRWLKATREAAAAVDPGAFYTK